MRCISVSRSLRVCILALVSGVVFCSTFSGCAKNSGELVDSGQAVSNENGNARKKTLAPLTLRTVHSDTRGGLHKTSGASLRRVIHELRSQKVDSDDYTFRNKAFLFESALNSMEEMFKTSAPYRNEVISILELDGGGIPFELAFERPDPIQIDRDADYMNYFDVKEWEGLRKNGFNLTFANFANYYLGGGWMGRGNVQEEQMAQQCPDFALILAQYNSVIGKKALYTRKTNPNGGSVYSSRDSAKPLLITHLRFIQKLADYYQRNFQSIHDTDFQGVHPTDGSVIEEQKDAPEVQMIALAAPQLRSFERKTGYSLELTRDLFNNAYRAYSLVKLKDRKEGRKTRLVLGLWGAGAFRHNSRMVLAIQYLAARLAGVESVLFTDVSPIVPGGKPESHKASFNEAIPLVDRIIKKHYQKSESGEAVRADQILKSILLAVESDSMWFTR